MVYLVSDISAQEVIVSKNIDVKKAYFYDIVGLLGDKYILLKDENSRYFMEVYNDDLTYHKSQELLTRYSKPLVYGIVGYDSNFNIFYEFDDEDKQKFIGINKYNNEGRIIDSLNILNSFNNSKDFRFISSDSHRTSLIFRFSDSGICDFYMISNNNLSLLWEKHIKLKRNIKRDMQLVIINDIGDLVIVSKTESSIFSKGNSHFDINTINKETIKKRKVSFKRKIDIASMDVSFNFVDNKTIDFYGFYSEDVEKILGIVQYSMNFNSDVDGQFNLIPFEDKVINSFRQKKYSEKRSIKNLKLKEVVRRKDNGFILIGEIEREFSRRAPRNRLNSGINSRGWKDFHHLDIVVISYSKDGNVDWINYLRKNQYTQDENLVYSSFFTLKSQNTLRFIFNDNVKNNTIITCYKVDNLGNKNRNTVFNTEDNSLKLRFIDAVQTKYNEVIVASQYGYIVNLVKFKFEE